MKVLLYEQGKKTLKKSGIGRALQHQKKALELQGIEVTFNIHDQYDFVHINSTFKKSAKFMHSLQARGIPVLVHGHSTEEDFRYSFRAWQRIEPWFDRNLKRIYSSADIIVTPTPYSKKLIENYSYVHCPVRALSNGIDLEKYAPDAQAVQAYLDYFQLKPQQKVIIGIGLPFERKGLIDFIDVAKKMPDIIFIWFGHLARFATHPKILRAIAQKPTNVIFPGYISGAVIRGALQRADAMLFPSYEETEGIVVLEALASRLPLIVRDIPVYEDWLQEGTNCFKGANNEDFIRIIYSIYEEDLSEMVNAGYQVAAARSLDIVGKGLLAIYQETIAITEQKKQKQTINR